MLAIYHGIYINVIKINIFLDLRLRFKNNQA